MNTCMPFSKLFSKVVSLFLLIMISCIQLSKAQASKSSELFKTLTKQDNLLFNQGFNHCNYEVLEKIVSKDLEFYHDVSGMQNRKDFFKATRENICSNPNQKPIRKLVLGTLKVYPLKNNGQIYGAVQEGIHQFYINEPGKDLYLTSTAKFTHLWVLEDSSWKLKTVLSYDHQLPQ